MKIDFRARGIEGTAELREHVARRIRFALGRFGRVIRAVRVRIEDVNGPRGGVDKRVVVDISGGPTSRSTFEVSDSSAWVAVDRVADIAGRSVARAIDRARMTGRRSDRPGWES